MGTQNRTKRLLLPSWPHNSLHAGGPRDRIPNHQRRVPATIEEPPPGAALGNESASSLPPKQPQ